MAEKKENQMLCEFKKQLLFNTFTLVFMYIYTGFHVHLYWFSCTFILVFMYIYTGFHVHLYQFSCTFILVRFHVHLFWFSCTFILVFMYIYTVFHFIMIFIIKSETKKILVTGGPISCFNFLLEKSKFSFFNSTFLKFFCNVSFVFLCSF